MCPSLSIVFTTLSRSRRSLHTTVSHCRLLTIPTASSLKHFVQLSGIRFDIISSLTSFINLLFHTSSIVWSLKFIIFPLSCTRPDSFVSSTPAPLAFAVQHTLTSPLGLVARCIQGSGQNVLLIIRLIL